MEINYLIQNLSAKGFKPLFFNNRADAIAKILEIIPNNISVGFGGSMTTKELELDRILQDRGNDVLSYGLISSERKDKLYQLSSEAEWYISSTNALTEQGDFVNIDGNANRISALAFGPKNIMYVLGTNKITKDVSSAINRIRNFAAPKNCIRLKKNTPCAKTGKCCDCNSEDCICNATLISHHPTRLQKNAYVIIINEELGY